MFRLKMIWIRLRALFQRDSLERDMDREFKFHLEMRIAENIQSGMSEKDARAAALRRFGSLGLAKERGRDVRGPGFIEPLLQDLKYGIRMLRNSPGFTAVAGLALAIGIGANTAVFSFMDAMFLRPMPLPDPDRLVRFYGAGGEREFDSFSYPNYADVRDSAKSFAGLAAHQYTVVNLTSEGPPEKAEAELVTGNYFDVLGVRPQIGRILSPDDDRAPGAHPVVVISDGLWKRRFGQDPRVLGRQLGVNGASFEIVGVLPSTFKGTFSAFAADLWAPMMMHEQVRPRGLPITSRGWGWLYGTGRLRPGVTRQQAQAEVTAIARQLSQEYPRSNDSKLDFQLMRARAMREQYSEVASQMLLFLMLAALVVLLITCGNIASVLLARAMARRGEIAVRQSLGAGRGRLVRQWITESVLLAVLGGVAGLLLAIWLGNAAMSLAPAGFASFSPDFRLDARTAAFAFTAAVLAGVFFGLFPAMWVRKADLASSLKHESGMMGARTARPRLHGVLISAQIALSVVLLIAAGLLFRSLRETNAFDPGFDTKDLLIADVNTQRAGYRPGAEAQFYPRLAERIRALHGVRAVTSSNVIPLGPFQERSGVLIPGRQNPNGRPFFSIDNAIVGPDYFSSMAITISSGRAFNADEFRPDARPVIIVGETMARQFWPGESALGKTVKFSPQGPDVEIVGVARDIKYYDLDEKPLPYMYRPFGQAGGNPIMLIRTGSDAVNLIPLLKSELAAIDPHLTWEHTVTFAELRRDVLMPARAMLATAGIFGAIALAITAIGLYGVISYSVNRRTAEFGVRIALGASRADILRMVIKDGVALTAIGSLVGLLTAFGVTRFLSSQLFGISPTDPLTFVTITSLMFVVSVVACYLPARRATRIAPTLALRGN